LKTLPANPAAFRFMMDASEAFSDVEERGMRIDLEYLDRAIDFTEKKIQELGESLRKDDVFRIWRKKFGRSADLGKRKQLSEVLYKEMGYEIKKRTKSGEGATNQEAFEGITHPFVKDWVLHEQLKSLLAKNLKGTLKLVDPNGLLHPSFHFNLVTTYRSSSSDPNFHNYPNRDRRLAKIIRTAFVPRSEEYLLVEADYGALEFRGAACFWKDPEMIAYADDDTKDIHYDMAGQSYKLEREEVTKAVRGFGKNKFVFPTLYGSYYKNTARNLWEAIQIGHLQTADGLGLYQHLERQGIGSKEQFESHIENVASKFEKKFSVWAKKRDEWWDDYCKYGAFPLMTGFVCRGQCSYNNLMNTPIQGPSFHLLLWSMIRVNDLLREREMKSMVIGQIHDSISLDVHKDEFQEVMDMLEQVMTIDVREHWDWVVTRLEIEAEATSTNWYEKKPFAKNESGVWVAA